MSAESTEATDRPTFTVSSAAQVTGKSRRTIARMLDAEALPGATRDDSGAWCIPLEALLAAGLQVHAPSPPDDQQEATERSLTPTEATEAEQLRAELADWRRRAEVAEAIAAERAAALADVRSALDLAQRMLPASTPSTPSTTPTPIPTTPTAEPRPRWWRKARP